MLHLSRPTAVSPMQLPHTQEDEQHHSNIRTQHPAGEVNGMIATIFIKSRHCAMLYSITTNSTSKRLLTQSSSYRSETKIMTVSLSPFLSLLYSRSTTEQEIITSWLFLSCCTII